MTLLLVCWFLFALPLLLAGAFLLGAHVYHKGTQGTSPGVSLPKFSINSHKNNGASNRPRVSVPDV